MNPLIQLGLSLAAVLFMAAVAWWLKLGGDARIRNEQEATALADQAICGFKPVAIALDRAGIGALLRDGAGRQMLIRRNGAHFVGRLLDRNVVARLDRNFLTIGTGERTFGSITLDLGADAQYWASGLRHLQ
ncbi:MAG: hypothetical protein IPF48_07795 [Sphingomonadales bacterium]|jgi:hypothetical protein|nr:hypothetical protein [Sphingomonadales bacterium]MBP7136802.1 hypothetical protein [Sphingomonadaceae bacterium]MBK6491879.1 hypothetical protein [Sphingomonadales bacterium]MBK6718709.1 hypothetical protein [Sphingomonadales bacterium]MBK8271887.1 hypothetical protein [Sphingomonadales bacterium]